MVASIYQSIETGSYYAKTADFKNIVKFGCHNKFKAETLVEITLRNRFIGNLSDNDTKFEAISDFKDGGIAFFENSR